MSLLEVRDWQPSDNPALESMLQKQLAADPAWPPAYAHQLDLCQWLADPATLARWVAFTEARVVGHMGLGAVQGEIGAAFAHATGLAPECFAELCRTVVDPGLRKSGVAGLLTRKALKTALKLGKVPVATVLTGRGTWLQMMIDTGWQRIGEAPSKMPDEDFVLLLPPRKFMPGHTAHGR